MRTVRAQVDAELLAVSTCYSRPPVPIECILNAYRYKLYFGISFNHDAYFVGSVVYLS